MFNDYYHQYSTNEKAYIKIIESDFSNPMDLDVTNFERNNDFMFHGHDKAVCPSLKALKNLKNHYWISSACFLEEKTVLSTCFSEFYEYF